MILRNIDASKCFELHILRYEFPDASRLRGSDLGCLMVSIRLGDELGEWRATDPCLEYYDVHLLAAWFRTLAQGGTIGSFIHFDEPCLGFSLRRRRQDARVLDVYLGQELRPPDRPIRRKKIPLWRRDGSETGFYMTFAAIEFALTPENLLEAADSLMEELHRLPAREGIPKPAYIPQYLSRLGVAPSDEFPVRTLEPRPTHRSADQ